MREFHVEVSTVASFLVRADTADDASKKAIEVASGEGVMVPVQNAAVIGTQTEHAYLISKTFGVEVTE